MYEALGLLSGALASFSYVPYVFDIVRRDTHGEGLSSSWLQTGLYMSKSAKPARSAWFIWTLASGIAFFSQLRLGSSSSLWFTGTDAVGSLVVLLLSFKYGYGGVMKRDLIGLMIVAAGLVVWRVTGNALYALLFAIAAEAVGAGITILKTIEHPNQETYPAWILLWIASLMAALSVGSLNFAQLAYPAYVFLFTGVIVASIFFGRMRRARWANFD